MDAQHAGRRQVRHGALSVQPEYRTRTSRHAESFAQARLLCHPRQGQDLKLPVRRRARCVLEPVRRASARKKLPLNTPDFVSETGARKTNCTAFPLLGKSCGERV